MSFIIADHTVPDDPIIFCNTAFERLTGYRREEILGHNCRFLQGDDRNQRALDTLRSAIKTGADCSLVLRNYQKDGTPFKNELVISPVRNAADAVTHLIGIQRDLAAAICPMNSPISSIMSGVRRSPWLKQRYRSCSSAG